MGRRILKNNRRVLINEGTYIKGIWYNRIYLNKIPSEKPQCERVITRRQVFAGIILTAGRCAKQTRNTMYLLQNDKGEEYYEMSCNPGLTEYTLLSITDGDYIVNTNSGHCWGQHSNGYITKSANKVLLHRYIMNRMFPGDKRLKNKKISIDHINWNKTDNRRENLRFATMSIQNSNRDKPARSKSCRYSLPSGITEAMIPKYVGYRKTKYNNKFREFFELQHPKYGNFKSSSKYSISILDKLKHIKKILKELEDGTYKKKEPRKMPPYYCYSSGKLDYRNRKTKKRLIMKLKSGEDALTMATDKNSRFNIALQNKYSN
jgi:hypothetical protein